jgi:hypothetical protein
VQQEQNKLHQEQTRRQEQRQREQMQQATEDTTSMTPPPPSHMGLQPLSQMGQQSPPTGLVVRGSSEVVGLVRTRRLCCAHALVKTCC